MKNDKRTNIIMAKGKRQKDKQCNGKRKMTKGKNIIMTKGKTTKVQTI